MSGAQNPHTILAVDDDSGTLALMQRCLEDEGHCVVGFGSGAAALAWLAANRADLLLLDLRLPDMSGPALLGTLAERNQSMPFIAVTAHGDESVAADMLRRGAYDYLIKDGALIERLPAVVQRTLRELEHERQLASAEQSLRESERFLRDIFDAIRDGLSVLDRDLNVVRVNAWMEMKFARNLPLVGRKCYAVYQRRSSTCPWCPSIRALETGETHTEVVPYVTDHGTGGWSELTAFPLRGADGRIRGVIEHIKDITQRKNDEAERRRLEAQIQHAQKLESLGVLAGGIAHDFNNLLVGVLGNAGLALEDLPPSAPARDSIERVIRAAQRAAELTKQLLAYSGRGRFVIEPLNLSDLVHEIAHLLETSITKSAQLRFEFPAELPLVEADATQMRQVVMNLIINASEAIGEQNGLITLRTGTIQADRAYLADACPIEDRPAGPYVYLEVTDTGVGMDEATCTRVFDPFFSTKFTGRGLGLAAVLGIVRGHRGAIKIRSAPGRGTTFTVLLPGTTKASAAAAQAQPAAPAVLPGRTVLVVDDDEAVRSVARLALERSGYTVLIARDGAEAQQVFRAHAPTIDAVVLDLTMPQASGEQVFHELRRMRADVRVVLSSGYGEQDMRQRFGDTGFAGFLQKPYLPSALAGKVAAIVGAGGGCCADRTPQT